MNLTLSGDCAVLLQLVAAHDGVTPVRLVDRLVAAHAETIGLAALADVAERSRGSAGDLVAVPDFTRAEVARPTISCRGQAPP